MNFKKICFNCMRENDQVGGYCPYCGFKNEDYKYPSNYLRPLTPLNGKYLIGRALGAGGFGITYVALDLHLQVVVAIKELYLKKISVREESKIISVNSKDKTLFEDNKKRFLQEARVLAMFNEKDNEGVVVVKDHFEENNTAYIVMEYLDGLTLKELVKKNRLTIEQVKNLFEPICRALTQIHQFGVVHLDVSPDNIMIMENNRAKLLDFGGAKTVGVKDEHDTIVFKRGYAPPEQYMENGRLGYWTDVYATAATMYYCLTGVKPIDSMERKAGAELEKPSKLGAKISPATENIILKAMDIDPAKRYQTMEEFWDALNNKKKRSNADLGVSKATKRGQKKGGNIGTVIGVVVALTAVIISVSMLLHKPKQETPDSSDSSGSVTVENSAEETLDSQDSSGLVTVENSAEEIPKEVGEIMPVIEGTYQFENAVDRSILLGVNDSMGDDGANLVLSYSPERNSNKFVVYKRNTSEEIYNLQVTHTMSYVDCFDDEAIGMMAVQNSKMEENESNGWQFIYCGYDEQTEMSLVMIQNTNGYVLSPENSGTELGNKIVLTELNMSDDSQKWYMRWSEKDPNQKDVIVHAGGDMVEDIEGSFNVSSALDGKTSMCLSYDTEYHAEPTVVVFYADWLTNNDRDFIFEFVPIGEESRYRIYPVNYNDDRSKCLEYNPDTNEIVLRDKADNNNQLFRLIYAGMNNYLIQTYNESVLGFDLDANGQAVGMAVLSRPYDDVEDSRLESWRIVLPNN